MAQLTDITRRDILKFTEYWFNSWPSDMLQCNKQSYIKQLYKYIKNGKKIEKYCYQETLLRHNGRMLFDYLNTIELEMYVQMNQGSYYY